MDSFDRKILALYQENCRRTSQDLAENVGLSIAACHKRLQRLRREGFITREVAVLAPEKLGRPLTLIVAVRLEVESVQSLDAFRNRMRDAPEVMQCYHTTGEEDFIVILTTRDMEEYTQFTETHFIADPNVLNFVTRVVMNLVKTTLAIPIDDPVPDPADNPGR